MKRSISVVSILILFFSFLVSCAPANQSTVSQSELLSRNDTIKTADISIKVDDPDASRGKIYSNLSDFGAQVTHENWDDEENQRSQGWMEIRLPSEKFLSMVDWFRENFTVGSMELAARETEEWDVKNGNVKNGIVYSTIYIEISRKMDLMHAIRLGAQDGGDALEFSLRWIIPVLSFLLPYAVVVIVIIFFIKFGKYLYKEKILNKKK
jgi:hypothetical protein